MKRTANGRFNSNYNQFVKFQGNAKARPLAGTSGMNQRDSDDEKEREYADVFMADVDMGCPYNAWKLYFPDKKFSQSVKISVKIQAVMNHFKRFKHWYDMDKVLTTYSLDLKVENFVEDEDFDNEWPEWYEDLTNDPYDSFSLIGLALHTVLYEELKNKLINYQLKKLFIRPVGWRPITDIVDVFDTKNTLVSIVGVVKKVEPIKLTYRFMCYKCKLCSAELFVRQNPHIKTLTRPSKCIAGCRAKGGFNPLITSQFTIVAPTQTVSVQEIIFDVDKRNRSLEVQLNEEQVDTVYVGSEIVLTGVLKYRADKTSKHDGNSYVPYVETFSVFNQTGPGAAMYKSVEKKKIPDIVPILRGNPNLFKILINSLCPIVYGREEAKAAILLALFSGFNLIKARRSNAHILLLGNPGTAKSTLMIAAASVAPKAMMISGVVATQPGMTASVSTMGTIEAGALILSDNGVCFIDEIDKLQNPQRILLEPMEQQTVSITKCGAVATMPARCSIIAAANPVDNVYDENISMIRNINFTSDIISRFDLIVPFVGNIDVTNNDLPCFMDTRDECMNEESQSSHWLDGNIVTIPLAALKSYIEFTQQNFHPKLSPDACHLIRNFFVEHTDIIRGNELVNEQGPARTIESVVRLTLSRARAEMLEVATAEHAHEIIELFKYTQIDIYQREVVKDMSTNQNVNQNLKDSVNFGVIKRIKKPENVSALSKPKQMKAFIEFISNKSEEEDRNEFTRIELKTFGAEIGLKDFEEIIYRLNNDGILLKTVDGYRLVSL